MKKLALLILLLCGTGAFAQDKQKIKEDFFGPNAPAAKIIAIPEKWKKESAVVIYKNENYDFHKSGFNITYTSSFRKRIKLQDQAAVKEFSEFSFKNSFHSTKGYTWREGVSILGIKIVKPDGTEKEINVDQEAIKTDDTKKIAIPDLEIGDIIDYYYHTTEPFKSSDAYGFEPVETTLADRYPIMDFKLTFKTENDFFVNFNTYNGAPNLVEVSPEGSKERRYELTATNLEKNDFPRWYYPLVEAPSYKFQVYFARSGKYEERAGAFLPKKESIIKQTVSKEDVLAYYKDRFVALGDLKDINKFIKKKVYASDEEKVKDVYYYTRHQYYTRYVEAFMLNEAKIMYPFNLYGNYPVFFNSEKQFVNHFIAFLKDQKIDYNIIVATPRINGPISDLLLENNLVTLLRVNTKTPVYLQFFTPYTNADQIPGSIENSDAYDLKIYNYKEVVDIETIKLPTSTYKDNRSESVANVSFAPDFNSAEISKQSSLYGHTKDAEQREKMYFFNYVDEDYTKYETMPVLDMVSSKKKKEQYTKEFSALKEKLKDKQKEEAKAATESEYGFPVSDHTLQIVSTGRFGSQTPFTFTEKFTVKDKLAKKAGNNYVVEVGQLIGEQIDLEDKELKRTNNIYMPYPRSYSQEVVVTIPEGYTVSGLDKLNKKVENTTGGFVSSATIAGNILTLKAYKYYANYNEPQKNWADMTAFIEAAYQFTQEKVLLKKN